MTAIHKKVSKALKRLIRFLPTRKAVLGTGTKSLLKMLMFVPFPNWAILNGIRKFHDECFRKKKKKNVRIKFVEVRSRQEL